MADQVISALPVLTTVPTTAVVPVVSSGTTYQAAVSAVRGAASGSWALATSWAFSSNVAQVDFIDLAGATDILVVGRQITQSVSGNLAMRLSTNNGSTFYATSGDYITFAATTGTEASSTAAGALWATSATAARSGILLISAANVTGAPRIITNPDNTASIPRVFVADTSNAINAIRLFPSGGGNITGGSLYVFTR